MLRNEEEILRERGYPGEVIYAIKSHADCLTDCPRVSRLDKTPYAGDELAGLITAAALVRPSGITDLETSSVKKKLKQKSFSTTPNLPHRLELQACP